jgi:hypothetical protein
MVIVLTCIAGVLIPAVIALVKVFQTSTKVGEMEKRQDRQMQDIRDVKDATNGLQAKVAVAEHAKGLLEGQEQGKQIARDLKQSQDVVAENVQVTAENVEVKHKP